VRIICSLVAIVLMLTACSSREVVIVYSPHGPDILSDYEKRFEAAHPEVDVQWLDLGSKTIFQRVRAERNRPAADVWWGAPATMFIQAADEGLLAEYKPTWAGAVPAQYRGENNEWYGIYASPLGIAYNTGGNSDDTVPQAWDDLLAPEWHNKITIRQPLESGTMRTFIGATIMREGGVEEGLAWLRKLDAATEAYMPNPQQLYDHMKRNPELITVWLMPDIALQRERHGYPLKTYIPPQTPVILEGIAIIEDAPNREWAERFYEFVTAPDALVHQAEEYWKAPVRIDLDRATLPEWLAQRETDILEINWREFAQKEEDWANLWREKVKGGS